MLASQQRRLRHEHGVVSEFNAKYTFYDLGFNIRPTEITGFLGRYQMRFLADNIAIRQRNYLTLEAVVKENPDLVMLDRSHIALLSSFAFPVVCASAKLRDLYLNQFSGAGVEIRPMIAGNIQRQPFFGKYVPEVFDLPGSDLIHDCGFYCGNYPELS
ncbi:MAG: DegT/DnrJ/EryC1/StrS family aminotransferase, partial [Gemmatimonadaceae bacterium]|nr:DegT/DnrJ/EryC1/StrS family aminotransferase [Gemmatimonadaceae bacterium]